MENRSVLWHLSVVLHVLVVVIKVMLVLAEFGLGVARVPAAFESDCIRSRYSMAHAAG